MKKHIIRLMALALIAISLTSCFRETIIPSGRIETEEYAFQNIKGINVGSNISVELTQDPVEGVYIDADHNLFPFLRVSERHGIIHVDFKPHLNIIRNHHVTVQVYYKDLEYVELSDASKCRLINPAYNLEHVEVVLSGASKFEGYFESETFRANLSGASHLNISGQTNYFQLHSTGASKAYGYQFACQDMHAYISGAGIAQYYIENSLNGKLSGASKLYYDGHPSLGDFELSGASKLIARH